VSTPVPCTGGTAIVTVTGTGGTLPYSFTFNGVTNTTGIFNGILPGTGYSWIVNDANGCSPSSGTIDVTEPSVISGSIMVTSAIKCNGGSATVTLTGTGGTAPLIYTFNGVNNASGIFSGIPAGTAYTWNITDVNNCSPVTGTIDITEPPALTGTITSQTNVTVVGGNDGSVTAEGSGGTPPYLYRLNSGSYQASGTFSTLTAGSYTITIQDAVLCEFIIPVTITDPSVPLSGTLVSKVDVSCFGGNNGSLTVTGIAGIAPYEYSLNGADYQASGTFTNLKAGTYIVTVRDAKPATFPVTVILTEPATTVSATATGINNLCNGDNSGKVIAVAAGGTGPYGFSWNTSPVQLKDTVSNLAAGTYIVTVTDANGCIVSDEVTITAPPALALSVSTTEADCPDTNDGSITLTITGGTAPYTPLWQDGNTSQNRSEMLPGTYTVTVTDANGCATMKIAEVGFIGTFGCVEIPQIITPNNDGFNDEWRIRNIDLYPEAEILVYTRWGKLVYKSRNISADPWDGRFNGRLMPTDSYHYILYLNDGSKPRSGVISIIR
jgi:gliding motility-associated-like protein